MSAAPQLAPGPEAEQPPAPAPAQETPKPSSLNEVLTGAPAPVSPESLRETETRLAQEGMAKVNEMGKNLNLQAEAGAQEFKQETKSVWERIKGRFSKKEGAEAAPVKGETEILQEIEKADATFREFRNEMARIMAHGGESDLRVLESNLSAAYEQLAPQVATEGAAESKAMKKALKTGEMPQATETGTKLNYVAKRLADVRAKLASGATGSAEALAAANAAYQEQASAPAPAESPTPVAEAPQAETAPAEPKKVETKADRDRSELEKASVGRPGAKLVDEYLKVRDIKSDKYGNIAARAFDPVKGEIRLTYEDGSQLRRYATGLTLRILPGGKVEEVKPEAQIVEEAESEEEIFDAAEKARLIAEGDKARRIAEMGKRVDAAMEAEDEAAASEGVTSGVTESKPEPAAAAQEESVIVSPEAHVSPALEKVTKELDEFDFDKAKEDLLLNFRIGPEVGRSTVERWKKKREEASTMDGFKRMLSEEYDIPADEIEAIPAGDLAAQHERLLSTLDRLVEAGKAEMGKGNVKTSEQAPVASGEIENKTVLQKSKSSAESPTASGEIDTEPAPPAEAVVTEMVEPDIPEAAAEAPPAALQPDAEMEFVAAPPAAETAPKPASTEVSEGQLAKAKENPLASESLPALVKTLGDKGKANDGKFATPASFMQALEDAGFKLPSDMEADDPKKLHEAYKKALRAKK